MIAIQLENGYLDLPFGIEDDFFITKRLHRIEDIETRDSDISKDINIPRTTNNIKLLELEMPSFRGIFSSNAQLINCQILFNGLSIIKDAQLGIISEDIRNRTIEIIIFGGTLKFFKRLLDDSIRLLDFSEYNLTWDIATLQTKINTTEGFLYGDSQFVDNISIQKFKEEKVGDNVISMAALEVDASGGWFYLKTIFLKILESIDNLTFDTTFFDDFLSNLVVLLPVTQNVDDWDKPEDIRRGIVRQIATKIYTELFYDKYTFDTIDLDEPPGFWDDTNQEFIFTEPGIYFVTFEIRGKTRRDFNNNTGVVKTSIRLNGIIKSEFTHTMVSGDEWLENALLEVQVDVLAGDVIFTHIQVDSGCSFEVRQEWRTSLEVIKLGSSLGRYVEVANWMPDISQVDFVKEFLKLAHLIPIEENNHVKFIYWDKIQEQEEKNITEFLDVSKSIKKIGYIPGYARENIFKYTDHSLVLRPDTDAVINQDAALLEESKVLLQSKFVACDLSEADGRLNKLCSPLFSMDYEHVDENKMKISQNSPNFETLSRPHGLEPGDHLFIWNDIANETMKRKVVLITTDFIGQVDADWDTNKDNTEWDKLKYTKNDIDLQIGIPGASILTTINDGGLNFTSDQGFMVRFTDALEWEGLINTYYKKFKADVFRPTMVQAWFNFPISVYNFLEIDKPVYVELEGGQFYINEISQYKHSGETRLDLLKLTNVEEKVIISSFDVTPIEQVDLGDWTEGNPPFEQIYQIQNTGDVPVTVDIILSNTYYEVYGSNEITIPVGDILPVTIRFNGGDERGSQPCTISFNSTNALGLQREIIANINIAQFTVEPVEAVNIGDWQIGDAQLPQTYNIINTGDIDLSISFNSSNISFVWQTASPVSVPIGATVQVDLLTAFEDDQLPQLIGSLLTFEAVLLPIDSITRNVYANILEVRDYSIEPPGGQDLGDWNVGDPQLEQIWQLTNLGNSQVTVYFTSSIQEFVFETTSPVVIPINGTIQVVIKTNFNAQSSPIELESTLTFTASDMVDKTRQIKATVIEKRVYSVEPVGDVNLGSWTSGEPQLSQTYNIINQGNVDIDVAFVRSGDRFTWQTASPIHLLVGTSIPVEIRTDFKYWHLAELNSTILTFSSAGLSDIIRNLQATILAYEAYTVEPIGDVNLGSWLPGSPPKQQTYALENVGNVALNIILTLTNQVGSWNIVTASPIPLPILGTANAVIEFTGELDADDYSVTFNFRKDLNIDFERNLIIDVPLIRSYSCEPSANQDLGDWNVGDPALTKQYLLENTGTVDIEVAHVLQGVGYSLDLATPITLNVGDSKTLTLSFDGVDELAGHKPGNFTLTSSGIANKVRTFEATVVALYSFTCLPVGDVAMGTWHKGDPALTQQYFLENTGNIPISLSYVIDNSEGVFEISLPSPIFIPAGSLVVLITLSFTSGAVGSITGGFTLSNPNTPDVVRVATVIVNPLLTIMPGSPYDMGNWKPGDEPLLMNYNITNNGEVGHTILIEQTEPDAIYFELEGSLARPIASKETIQVIIRFVGHTQERVYNCDNWFEIDVPSISMLMELSASVWIPPPLVVEPVAELEMQLGDQDGWTLKNNSTGTIAVTPIVSGIGIQYFAYDDSNFNIAPGETKSWNIMFNPTAPSGLHVFDVDFSSSVGSFPRTAWGFG